MISEEIVKAYAKTIKEVLSSELTEVDKRNIFETIYELRKGADKAELGLIADSLSDMEVSAMQLVYLANKKEEEVCKSFICMCCDEILNETRYEKH